MSTRINLLPWREVRRKQISRQVVRASFASWILMGLVVGYAWWFMDGKINAQEARNAFLTAEIAKLDQQIADITDLKKRRAALIARMEVIQRLQEDRTQIVHLFDDLVRKLPEGVYLTNLNKQQKRITLRGVAQSNARVSALMRNLDASVWFADPDLNIINVKNEQGKRTSHFTLLVNQDAKNAKQQPSPDG
ncbi:MAG: PilN domain-containing protein [Gammaproteobacteria bacterium]|jgi:type IV pilus assembly protein PilN|nr:PilN domain-containing protein [Gammaproteobacteria bacterium]